MSQRRHAEQTVLITGASNGIGAACAERFLAEDWDVIGWDKQRGEDTRVTWHPLDVSDWDAVSKASGSLPPLAAVINCAGIGSRKSVLNTSRKDWDRIIAVNLNGVFYVARWTFNALRATQGVLVNIASITATNGFRDRSAYCASKAAVLSLTQCLAIEWAEEGVRVLAVSPGFTRTPLLLKGIQEGKTFEEDILRRTPQRRLIESSEIANAIFRLVNDDFRALTGSNVFLDGGWDAYGGF
jgi:NAD(P)-dependent dehydrogenase (short-subunit alcohol dehydrogenase family)